MQRALTWIANGMIAVGSAVLTFVLMTFIYDWFDAQGFVIGLGLIFIGAVVKVVISEQH